MSSYGVFADFYDELTMNVNYRERAEYVLSILRSLGHEPGLCLDLACGTGELTVELKSLGVDVYGVDGSEEMLSVALEKSAERGLDILFLCQKMQSLDLYGTIDTCVCTLDSINHLTEIADVQAAFDRVSLFMNPGGYFIFDVNTPYKHREVLADNTFVYDTDEVFCVWQNSTDSTGLTDIDLSFFVPDGELYERFDESFSERAYTREELTEMLRKAGFELVAVYGDMTLEPPREDEQRAVYVVRKRT